MAFNLLTGSVRFGQAPRMRFAAVVVVTAGLVLAASRPHAVEPAWPKLPERDGAVMIPAQGWPLRPGPRQVRVLVHYPAGTCSSIGPRTGIFLTLHNWGGTDCDGTASPQVLAKEFNVVALCVNYLQRGPEDGIKGVEPYEFGWLQGASSWE